MELIIIIAALIGAAWWITAREKTLEESNRHPLDGATRKEPDLTTKPDGIGHESVPVLLQVLDVNKDGKVDAKDAQAVKITAEAAIKKPRKPRVPKPLPGKSAADRVE